MQAIPDYQVVARFKLESILAQNNTENLSIIVDQLADTNSALEASIKVSKIQLINDK